MYFKEISQLPDPIRQSLTHAEQKEYLEVFNSAWKHYQYDESLKSNEERASTVHQVAWDAIKHDQQRKRPDSKVNRLF